MAFPASYVNGKTIKDTLEGAIAFDANATTVNVALFTNAMSGGNPNAIEAYGVGDWSTTNEVVGAGYTAGGQALYQPSITDPLAGRWSYGESTAYMEWANSTINARGALLYIPSISNRVLAAINFGEDVQSINSSFFIFWDSENRIFHALF